MNVLLRDEPRWGARLARRALPTFAGLLVLGVFTLARPAQAAPPPGAAAPAPAPKAEPPPQAPDAAARDTAAPAAPAPEATPPSKAPEATPPKAPEAAPPSKAPEAAPGPPVPAGPPPPGPLGAPLGQQFTPAWNLPPEMPYREGDIVPRGYHVEERRSFKLPVVGGVLFAASYGLSTAFAGSGLKNAEFGYIPLVGPFIAMAAVEVPYQGDTTTATFAVTGIGELVGVAVLIYGLVRTDPWLVQDQKGGKALVAPMLGKSSGGLEVIGVF